MSFTSCLLQSLYIALAVIQVRFIVRISVPPIASASGIGAHSVPCRPQFVMVVVTGVVEGLVRRDLQRCGPALCTPKTKRALYD